MAGLSQAPAPRGQDSRKDPGHDVNNIEASIGSALIKMRPVRLSTSAIGFVSQKMAGAVAGLRGTRSVAASLAAHRPAVLVDTQFVIS
jgi:hypothetical protein